MPERCRLLVPGHSRDGDGIAEPVWVGNCDDAARGNDLRQDGARNPEPLQERFVPVEPLQVQQLCARGIADVRGMDGPARELGDQPGVDGSKSQFAPLGAQACLRHVIEQPGELGSGKIRIEHEAGTAPDFVLQTLFAQARTLVRSAPVLPDNGIAQCASAIALPQDGGFALIGDADGSQIVRAQARALQGLAGAAQLRFPDFLGIVLHPSRLWIDLPQFAPRHRHRPSLAIEDDCTRTGRPLIQGQNVPSLLRWFPCAAHRTLHSEDPASDVRLQHRF